MVKFKKILVGIVLVVGTVIVNIALFIKSMVSAGKE